MPKRKSTSQHIDGMVNPQAKKAKNIKKADREATKASNINELRILVAHLSKTPLDIVGEIFSYLRPNHLLWLARSTRNIRTFLMNESGSHLVWETARNNEASIPPKPADVDEPLYASLMFDTHCFECLRPNCTTFFWEWNKRLCDSCEKSLQVRENDFDFTLNPPLITKADFLALVPSCKQKTMYKLEELYLGINQIDYPQPFWLEDIVDGYLVEYESEVRDEGSFAQWKMRLETEKDERESHVKNCLSWHMRKLNMPILKEKKSVQERYRAILNRLGGRRAPALRDHPSVKIPKKLTDAEFEKMKTELDAKFPKLPRKPFDDESAYEDFLREWDDSEAYDDFIECFLNDEDIIEEFLKCDEYDDFEEFVLDYIDDHYFENWLDDLRTEHYYYIWLNQQYTDYYYSAEYDYDYFGDDSLTTWGFSPSYF